MTTLLSKAVSKGWTSVASIEGGGTLELAAPLLSVEKALVKALKPRKTLSAFRVSGGKIEEVYDAVVPELVEKAKTAEVVAATVEKPFRGCPEPDYEAAELKAGRVLAAFLTSEQLADFERENAFVAIGADTGHRYAVTSRHARGLLAQRRRAMYDLDEARPFCVHLDATLPAAEEMLAIFLFLSLPGWETYLRKIPG